MSLAPEVEARKTRLRARARLEDLLEPGTSRLAGELRELQEERVGFTCGELDEGDFKGSLEEVGHK